jgi:hypothetical protein
MALWRPKSTCADVPAQPFDVTAYWRQRYDAGGSSGKGSYRRLAAFKAEVINDFVKTQGVSSAIELGCGDGNQFSLLNIPYYVGLDISESAVTRCRTRFAGRNDCEFHVSDAYPQDATFDLALSLDVIFHLVADDIFSTYMRRLFKHAKRFVIIYSSNRDDLKENSPHVRHRRFTPWIDSNVSGWELVCHIPNRFPRRWFLRQDRSPSDFYIFARQPKTGPTNG